jgi:hypothetical protein
VFDEMKQLHFCMTFVPKHWHSLTKEQKSQVLEAHLYIKQKSDGTINGRAIKGGSKQWDYISQEDASSPMAATELVLLTAVIAAKEHRDVAVVDIPNAFIQTRVEREEDKVIIQVRGYHVDVLCRIDPSYKMFMTTNKQEGGETAVGAVQECNLWHPHCELAFLQRVRQDFEAEQI